MAGKVKLTEYDFDARVIYERHHSTDDVNGPMDHGKIGVAFGSEVFWTGSYWFPGTDMVTYNAAVGFATELANRWNAGRAALSQQTGSGETRE